jgi:hypothetical protein
MLTAADFITLPYTPDLTQAGIAYACRSLAYTYDRMGGSPTVRLRRIVVGVAVELVFRRLLIEQEVPHDTLGATPFTDPDHYDLALGGRRCDLKSFLIFDRNQIHKVRHDPATLLQAAALVPLDQSRSDKFADEDIYVFVFITALLATRAQTLERALTAGQPCYLIHPLPMEWSRPTEWISLNPLTLKSESPEPLKVELGGQNVERGFQSEQLTLLPLCRMSVNQDFFALASVHPSLLPPGRLGLHSPRFAEAYIVYPTDWENIWVYGMEVILVGYLPRGEFRRRAHFLPAGSRVWQYARTRTNNLTLPLGELRPLPDLFARVKRWAKK